MRKRYVTTAVVVALLSTAGALAFADPSPPGTGTGTRANAAASVTLPGGDTVTVNADGGVAIEPADDDRGVGYFRAGGTDDIVMIPIDKAAAIAAGEVDPRRYNVSALLRAGQCDAARAPKSTLDDREYDGYAPARPAIDAEAATQKVTVSLTDAGGGVPAFAQVSAADVTDPKKFTNFTVTDGVATAKLPPGDYDVVLTFGPEPQDGKGDIVEGIDTFTVADAPVKLAYDGRKGRTPEVSVDTAGAELVHETVDIVAPDSGLGTGAMTDPNYRHFVLPSTSGGATSLAFGYGANLVGPEDIENPVSYQLFFPHLDGMPRDLTFAPSDSELAEVATDFESLGAETSGEFCAAGWSKDAELGMGWCVRDKFTVPSQQTVRYSPDPVRWSQETVVGAEGSTLRRFDSDGRIGYRPGVWQQRFNSAPLTVGLTHQGATRSSGQLSALPSLVNHFDAQTVGFAWGYDTTMKLTEGDTVLGEYRRPIDASGSFELEPDDRGRYTLSLHAEREPGDAGPLATSADATWEFDSPAAPGDEADPVRLATSNLVLAAEGVTNGYAKAGGQQDVTVEYRNASGSPATTLTELTFEVSYDDGETWKKVATDRDGNTATATLDNPADAAFASVRFTAVDDAGGKTTQETIHSFGFR